MSDTPLMDALYGEMPPRQPKGEPPVRVQPVVSVRSENVTAVPSPETKDSEMPTNPVWQALALHGLIPKTMNYNRGNNGTFAVAHDNTVSLMMELDRLCKIAETPIETCAMSNDEARWLFAVIRERPEWAHPTLARYGYTQAR